MPASAAVRVGRLRRARAAGRGARPGRGDGGRGDRRAAAVEARARATEVPSARSLDEELLTLSKLEANSRAEARMELVVDGDSVPHAPGRRDDAPAGEGDGGAGPSGRDSGGPSLTFSQTATSVLLLNLGAVLCGSNQVVIKATEDLLRPDVLTLLRFSIATLVSAPYVWRGLSEAKSLRAAGELGVWLWIGYLCQAIGLSQTLSSHGALTGTFTVLSVPMLAGLAGREIHWTTWASAVTAMFGVALLTGDAGAFTAGDAWCIGSAVVFGVHKYRTEALTSDLPALPLMAGQMFVVASLSLAYAALNGSLADLAADPSGLAAYPWTNLVFMGVFTTAAVLWIEAHALKFVSAPLAALIYSSEPVWGAAFAFAVGERFGPTGWIGAALVAGSSVAAQALGDLTKRKDDEDAA